MGCFQISGGSLEAQITIFESELLGNRVVEPDLLRLLEVSVHKEGSQVKLRLY